MLNISADGCFVKTNTINCNDNGNTMFLNTRAFAFTRQPMKQSFTWSTRAIHLRSSLALLCQLNFWFAKKLNMNLPMASTDTSFCKKRDHAEILIVFKWWCNCVILYKIIFQLEILRGLECVKKCFLKEEILLHYQNSNFFRTYANSNKMSGPLHVRINRCMLY